MTRDCGHLSGGTLHPMGMPTGGSCARSAASRSAVSRVMRYREMALAVGHERGRFCCRLTACHSHAVLPLKRGETFPRFSILALLLLLSLARVEVSHTLLLRLLCCSTPVVVFGPICGEAPVTNLHPGCDEPRCQSTHPRGAALKIFHVPRLNRPNLESCALTRGNLRVCGRL